MKKISCLLLLFVALSAFGQEKLNYQKPPSEILDLFEAPAAPMVNITENGKYMILMYRDPHKSIAELSEEELRLGGLRINPKTNIGSRVSYVNNLMIKSPKDKEAIEIKGIPNNPRLANFSLSPDQEKMALTNTTEAGVELWVLDLQKGQMSKLSEPILNANLYDVINWFKDSQSILVKTLPSDRKPLINTDEAIPDGPTISTNDGKKAQNRTYQDLLKNPNDEFNFEQLAKADLMKISLDGKTEKWKETEMYQGISFSPDGNYVMITTIGKPFSYLVPYSRFPSTTTVYDKDGNVIKVILEEGLIEELPQGFMAVQTGMRSIRWRSDKPSTLYYAEALDQGDPEVEVPFRDVIYEIEAPFTGTPRELLKTKNRYAGIEWGDDDIAIAYDRWWNTRNTKTYVFDPSDNTREPVVLFDRNYQDQYSNPGSFVSKRNELGSYVLALDKNKNAYLLGDGFSENGQFPFVDKINLKSFDKARLYTSKLENKKEDLLDYDPEEDRLLVRVQSQTEYPNYYYKAIKRRRSPIQLTSFDNPYKSLQSVHKEVITYKRADGLELSATLYLPVGYDMDKKEKMPMLMWAYPREYKDKNSASQNTQNPNEFTYPYWASPVYWVTRGYVVLDDAAFPIIGEGDKEPNDTFREQLVANAKAAIDAVDELGYIDRERVAVGGHSYGAFMVANLLSHSNLFAAGIARSGAYNRTLTPFGFQSEERNYWEAPEVYYTMSPFMHAEKMKTPLLLIHGQADNNSGTYPMQSERYFNALKGLGAVVRLVMLPKESHGYNAKESIMHMLWEQDQWLEKYVKNKGADMLSETK
ncbi:alpha/beta hydrolase family protein [Robertkochia solimangrovi]|uniref:alpha/beta hydrolase family protein n=1 Tax=Robertkochia solimangrovi TaxID=2213046 RepID=UPI0011807873|nr:prolyl oligopeptidase family serine peptidase [Robertkochia solimangrovi]TRZ41894.1 S9 family peptidase [Robertkochia solimangrovi]